MTIILLAVCLWIGSPYKRDSIPSKLHSESGSKQNAPPIIPPTLQEGIPCKICGEQPKENDDESRPWWQKPYYPSWTNVGITAIYTLVSLGMLMAIFFQYQSIKRAERAYLIPFWDNFVHISHNRPSTNGVPIRMRHTFNVDFQNCGKTPAFIKGVSAEIFLIDSITSLPPKPHYGTLVKFFGDPIPANAKTDYPFSSPIADDRPFEEIEKEFRTGGKTLFVRGVVVYEDIFRNRHETRYGLRYVANSTTSSEDHFVADGPPKYNDYT